MRRNIIISPVGLGLHRPESGSPTTPFESAEASINHAAARGLAQLQKGMGILATAAGVSPLLGLLGTVWGIIYAFINIGQQGSASIDTVAPGVAEALITTLVGLSVAIPALVGHNLLTVRINRCLDGIDRISEFAMSLDRGVRKAQNG